MTDPAENLQSRVSVLAEEVRRVQIRLAALEERARADGTAAVSTPRPAGATTAGTGAAPTSPVATTLVGRTLVILGGAYLIRALADAGVVPPWVGAVLGLAYAGCWLLEADRAARAGHATSAATHLVACGLIAFPLAWETTAHFGLLAPRAAHTLLVGCFALGMAVSDRRSLGVAGTLLTLMAVATAVALLTATHDLLAASCALLAIAAIVEASTLDGLWPERRWAPALVLDAVVLLMAALVGRPLGLPESYVPVAPLAAVLTILALPLLYGASLATRTVLRGRLISPFEMTQAVLALVVGLGGAWRVLAAHGQPPAALGAMTLVLGALCYAVAFALAERRTGHERNFYFYGTAAGLLTLVGAWTLLDGPPRALAGCGLGAGAAVLGWRFSRTTLQFHAAFYVLATALSSGLLRGSVAALFATAAAPAAGSGSMAWLVTPASLATYLVLANARSSGPAGWWNRLPQLVVAVVLLVGTAGVLTGALTVLLGAWSLGDAGTSAAAGTAVLAVLAVAAAWARTRWELPELGWVVYPILTLGGVKLIAVDSWQGRSMTLFASLVAYGMALIVAPQLAGRRQPTARAREDESTLSPALVPERPRGEPDAAVAPGSQHGAGPA